jgi:ABC-type phosphate transport system permease subunit
MTTTAPADTTSRSAHRTTGRHHGTYATLVGLSAVAILLQGVWAGIFLEHDGARDASHDWIEVHARGGEAAILLALLATAFAVWRLRSRRVLWLGGAALSVLLTLDSYLGGLIADDGQDTLTAIHVPLSMATLALAVWLPLRARDGRRTPA